MKIEKMNDSQIRCTLDAEDLQARKLKLSELAYGSPKARDLFREMIREASEEFGFEAENTPLMIEAIPTSPESLILVITKVDSPEELDAHFSSFSANPNRQEDVEDMIPSFGQKMLEQLGDFPKNLFEKLMQASRELGEQAAREAELEQGSAAGPAPDDKPVVGTKICAFEFARLSDLAAYAKTILKLYSGSCILYKHPVQSLYTLCLSTEGVTPQAFNRACNIACEYGKALEHAPIPFFEEHYQLALEEDTLQQLAQLA